MTPRERLFALEQFGIKLGLANITALVETLNRPDQAFPSVLIGGTNGKGSVVAMVERGLRAAGHRTGRYTSPHLTDIEERIAIAGVPVAPEVFDEITTDVLAVVDGLIETGVLRHPPTFFEATTAIAFEAFRRAEVSAAVVEVGLGGRYDATNVITPAISAITSIAFDHERHLGTSLADIASEKAGIIKTGVPVVAGMMPDEAGEVIERTARLAGTHPIWARASDVGRPVDLALNGAHQRQNAAVAVEILRLCGGLGRTISDAHILDALTDVEWPARLEWLRIPAGGDVLLDAAHNPSGAQALCDYVLSTVGPLPLVCAVMADKDVTAIVRALSPAVSRFVATTAPSPRALDAAALAEQIRSALPGALVDCYDDPIEGVRHLLSSAPRVVVAGSIFLVGPVRRALLGQGAATVRYSSNASRFFLN
ncbi:MAG TPA: folylpolyglutamate synthase/dihydrofolate synthase family protein [Vicinamibacterales bacterium]|nr:folylpolyglutamate synthase/dihydrofolate synthase family protein [Vicinamibacterales bacterium]